MWLTTFEGLIVPFLPFEVNPSAESLELFFTYIIILQVRICFSKRKYLLDTYKFLISFIGDGSAVLVRYHGAVQNFASLSHTQ